jgi:hypothetical protein
MPEEPQDLTANEWGAITYYPQWNTLELAWSPNSDRLYEWLTSGDAA